MKNCPICRRDFENILDFPFIYLRSFRRLRPSLEMDERDIILNELSATINACSRMDKSDIAISFCLGNKNSIKEVEAR